jgi:dTDP-4-amino-4,6-dideoxygalactose transaminase
VDVGSSYLPSDILAAFLYAQLEVRDQIQAKRKQMWEYYYEHLKGWAGNYGVRLPVVPPYCEHSCHMFYIVLRTLKQRQAMIEYLNERGINSVFHYLPLHLSEMGQSFGGGEGDCPVTEYVSDRLLRLPFHNHLSENDLEYVVESICNFVGE